MTLDLYVSTLFSDTVLGCDNSGGINVTRMHHGIMIYIQRLPFIYIAELHDCASSY
jgi:hypothetical protein